MTELDSEGKIEMLADRNLCGHHAQLGIQIATSAKFDTNSGLGKLRRAANASPLGHLWRHAILENSFGQSGASERGTCQKSISHSLCSVAT